MKHWRAVEVGRGRERKTGDEGQISRAIEKEGEADKEEMKFLLKW